ncbi:ROK family protein [Leptospira yanagawae serovar Saopaulo str. Sao Paulo = ATCC 700523]|uniref:ROK family protein n=1 Tax=Leptospira yanagawae serovar Saopaulo str. Sao Paulo = ATCC 700523 TaxID=1249483 RepID=A0A5E8HGF3_9LEPT|nr:ROK family protein [Leptospira yanagawae]EOQ90571.1 ROK family protein [Leptospira yanagawae serovar Saopaulo str. Sao Paulo = ATCC 700523]
MKHAIGVDIGGGSIRVSLFDGTGNEQKSNLSKTPDHLDNDLFLKTLTETIRPLAKDCIGIGVGSPGPLNNETGTLLKSANMQGLQNVPIKQTLEKEFSLPVYYENDANCAALGEAYFGTYKGCESQLILTLGTGVGGGFVKQGELYTGFLGNGIEIGHTTSVIGGALCGCGAKGCVESYFSTKGFLNRYFETTNTKLTDAESFFQLVRTENKIAKEILHFGTLALAHAVRGAIHLLNPEAVVFVGGITNSYDLFGELLENEIRSNIFSVLNERLKLGKGRNLSGTLGAASLVFANKKV